MLSIPFSKIFSVIVSDSPNRQLRYEVLTPELVCDIINKLDYFRSTPYEKEYTYPLRGEQPYIL